MTDHEKKQREILERYFSIERSQIYWQLSALERQKEKARSNKRIDQALSELSKLDTIPTLEKLDEPKLFNFLSRLQEEYERLDFVPYLSKLICSRFGKDAIPTPKEDILKKYEELTPQGSEFANDPENVYKYIKESLNSAGEAKKEVVRLRRKLAKSIPTSKEVEEAVKIAINSSRIFCEFAWKSTLLGEFNSKEEQIEYIQKMEDELVQTLIQAVKKCPCSEIHHLETTIFLLKKELNEEKSKKVNMKFKEAVTPKEEVGAEEIVDLLNSPNFDVMLGHNEKLMGDIAKALLTKYSIRKR